MFLAFTFDSPWLLLGLLAAAIPFALHLLSSVRARDMMFPTLRFLRRSMEKTARRRRLQHWLLLLLRAALFALLAICVSEPLSRAAGGWLGGSPSAAVVIVDNGYSMAAAGEGATRLERAKAAANALLGGDDKPVLAAVLTANDAHKSPGLTASLEDLRSGVARARVGYGRVNLAGRLKAAYEMLAGDSSARKAIYLFSDLQRTTFEEVAALDANSLPKARDVHLLVVDAARGDVANVGVASLDITGRRVVDSVVEFTAELVNSSATDRTVDVALDLDGVGVMRRVRKTLAAGGMPGSSALVRFHHRFAAGGLVTGKVAIDATDDLAADNVRRFALTIGDRVRALVVADSGADANTGMLAPAAMLLLALDPYDDRSQPWPIRPRTVDIGEFGAADLFASDIVFFADVPRFSEAQAKAIVAFVAGGGTAMFFLGPATDVAAYNERLVQQVPAEGGLLPSRLGAAVGEVGPAARSFKVDKVDTRHEYFAGLYERHADYLTVAAQRYYRFAGPVPGERTLVRLEGGDGLVQWKPFGSGRVVVCTTTANPKWTNLPISGLFLPLAARASLLARRDPQRDAADLTPGSPVAICPSFAALEPPAVGEKLFVQVTAPPGVPSPSPVPLTQTPEGPRAVFIDTGEIGLYRWQVVRASGGKGPSGAFVINPYGPECALAAMPPKVFQRLLNVKGLERVYVAGSLEAVNALATAESKGRNWWDLLAAAAIVVLVFESVVANRRNREEDAVAEHLKAA
jgi:hypothetical protein